MGPCPDAHPGLGGTNSNHIIGALRAHLDYLESGPTQGVSRAACPGAGAPKYETSSISFEFTNGLKALSTYCKPK